jgi:hypothetical protein
MEWGRPDGDGVMGVYGAAEDVETVAAVWSDGFSFGSGFMCISGI